MSQNKIKNIICIVAMWGLLIYVGYNVLTVEATSDKEKYKDFLSEENVDRSITFPGENEPGFVKTDEQKRLEELETIADIEDDLADENTPEQKEKIQDELDAAREKFGVDEEKLTGYDEEGRQLNVINGDYDEEPKQKNEKEREWYYNENTGSYEYLSDKEIKEHNMESESGIMQGENWGPETPIEPPSEPYPTNTEEVIEDWGNTVVSDSETDDSSKEEQTIKEIAQNIASSEEGEEVHGNAEIDTTTTDEEEETEPEEEQEEEESNDDESEESSDSNENEESE